MTPIRIASVILPADRSGRGDGTVAQVQDDRPVDAARSALRTLAAVAATSHDARAQQAQAAAKIAQCKARLTMLKLLYANDSGKLAAAAVQIARELARAVDAYVRAGGSDVSLGGSLVAAPVAPAAASQPAAVNAAIAAPAGEAEAAQRDAAATVTAARSTAGTATATAAGTRAAPAGAPAAVTTAGPTDRSTVAADVDDLVRMLRDILREAERKHHAPDRAAAATDLDQADAAIGLVPTGYAATLACAAVVEPIAAVAG